MRDGKTKTAAELLAEILERAKANAPDAGIDPFTADELPEPERPYPPAVPPSFYETDKEREP